MLMDFPLSRMRLLVVDDNSPDGTGQIAEGLADYYGRDHVGVVHRQAKEGLGKAYLEVLGARFRLARSSSFRWTPTSHMDRVPARDARHAAVRRRRCGDWFAVRRRG